MHGLSAIVGQAHALARLRAALASRKVHHAYLFDGPEGVGKRSTAIALAQALNCEVRPDEGCGACGACRRIDEGAHPDFVVFGVFDDEGKVKEQTERVRALIGTLAFPPHEGRARVVLIDPAHELNQTASNVLLKTLEEPPPSTHFVLVTTSASRLLVTIRSRCQRVAFAPIDDALIEEELGRAHGVEAAAARAAAALAGGSLGRALDLASSDELPKRRERIDRLVAAARSGRVQPALDVAAELSGDREETQATLALLWTTYRDAIVARESTHPAGAGRELAATLAGRVRTGGLLVGLRAIEEAGDALRGYVSPQLVLEHLLMRMQRGQAA